MGENICKQCNRQGLISKIYKQLIQLNNNKKPNQKWAEALNRHFYKEKQMANRHKKRWSILPIIRETQNYFTVVRRAIIKKSVNNKCWRGCGEKGTLLHSWWERKLVQPLLKTVWRYFRKLKTELPNDPANPFLDTYPDRTVIQKDTGPLMFLVALFTIPRCETTWCPSTNEWIKMWYTCTMEYCCCSVTKSDSLWSHWLPSAGSSVHWVLQARIPE